MTIEEIRARLEAIAGELRSINESAGDSDLTAEQTARWEELETEHGTRTEELRTAERAEKVRESRSRWGAIQVAPVKDTDTDVRRLDRGGLQSRAMRLVDSKETEQIFRDVDPQVLGFDFDGARAQEHISKLVRKNDRNFRGDAFARYLIASESDAYRSAFGKLMARGSNAVLTAEEGRAVELVEEMRAAMNITTDGQGGYGIPVIIDPTIILTGQGHPNDFLTGELARVESITNDEWKGVSSAGATSYWTTEGTTMTGGEPTLAQPTVTTKKLTTLVKYSFEVQGDYPAFAAEMAAVMGASHSETLVSGFTQGTGVTAQPTGIVTAVEANASTSKVMVTTDGALGAVDFYNVRDALPIRFRSNARWLMHTTVNSAIRQFGTVDPNFSVNITEEGASPLFGRPVNLNDYMDNAIGSGGVTSASDVTPAIFGDFRNFLIANRVGATVETMQHVIDTTTGNPTGQRATFMWARVGSGIINANAFRYLHQSA